MESKKVISSLIYKFLERFSVKALGLVISIILARMLTPDDFGQVAILMIFINLSHTLIHSGFNTSLVQKKETEEIDYTTTFYISLVLAIIFIVILYLLAPIIGAFYESPSLVLPLRVYSLSLLFGAFNSVQQVRMQKKMRFRSMMICSLAATVISGVLGVVLAYLNAGIWALIAYYFSNVIATSVIMLFVEKWWPKLMFSVESAKSLFGFGWKILISSLLCSLYADVRSFIIGKKFSTDMLGYYTRGQQFPNIIAMTLDNSIQSVMLPALSSVQDTKFQLKAMLRKSLTMGAWLILPAMVGLAAISKSFVVVFLTEKWLPCVIFMQLICIAEAKIPFTSSNLIALKAMGRSDVYMKLEAVRRVVMLLILTVSIVAFDSVEAIAVGYIISNWADVFIVSIPMKKLLNYGLAEQAKDTWKIFAATALMGTSVYLAGFLPINDMVLILIQIGIGVIIYGTLCVVFKIETMSYTFHIFKQLCIPKK